MNRTFGTMVTGGLVLGYVALAVLVGCDNSLRTDDPVSPHADVRITNIALPTGGLVAPFIGALAGTEATTPVTAIGFPELGVTVTVFNGISVTFERYVIDYFQEDGVTPLGVKGQSGFLTRFLLGGYPAASTFGTLDPSQTATGIAVGGVATRDVLQIPSVSPELGTLLSGSDRILGTSDDVRNLVVGVLTVFGEDVNKHEFRIQSRFTITTAIPIVSQGT